MLNSNQEIKKIKNQEINQKIKIVFLFSCFFIFLFSCFFTFFPLTSVLAVDAGLTQVNEAIDLSAEDPRVLAGRIIQFFLGFLGIIAVSIIVYAGYLWMTSGGDESKIEQAKKMLRNGVIGLIIILMAFSIASFLIRGLLGELPTNNYPTQPPGRRPGGIVAIGGCSLASVYPEPGQKEVPRNTSLIVTFKDEVDPATVCEGPLVEGKCKGTKIIKENIHIFRTKVGDDCDDNTTKCADNITDVKVYTKDNKTFVFKPTASLGSNTEYTPHSVKLAGGILKKENGKSMLAGCGDSFEWDFEVSNIIDLVPPKVSDNGVFPAPDNAKDQVVAGSEAVQAKGAINIKANPNVFHESSYTAPVASDASSPKAVITGSYTCAEQNNNIVVTITSAKTTQVTGASGWLQGDPVSDKDAKLGCGLVLKLESNGEIPAGSSWRFSVNSEIKADTLKIDKTVYAFVSEANPGNGKITVGSTPEDTASKINQIILSNHSQVLIPAVNGKIINLTANKAGADGNKIALISSTANIAITAMAGGKDEANVEPMGGAKDQPMNTGIRIDYNEAILPLTVAGDAVELKDFVRVKCTAGCTLKTDDPYLFDCDGAICVRGKFIISNQYRTLEFLSNNKCAVNECGGDIYCLPASSTIEVSFDAATLKSCNDSDDCADLSPYAVCDSAKKKCKQGEGDFYPGVDPSAVLFPEDVMDLALNSLDGNRDVKAKGPENFFNQNPVVNTALGDSYKWSFNVSDKLDIGAPKITGDVYPPIGNTDTDLSNSIEVTFDKVLMSSSLVTGSVIANNGEKSIEHKGVNLISPTSPVGYWITNEIGFTGGYPDSNTVFINHTQFSDSAVYRAQFGSAIKDIYQNCYKPSASSGCNADKVKASCCEGVAAVSCE